MVSLSAGVANIALQMFGGTPNGSGYYITAVKMKQLIKINVGDFSNNPLTSTTNLLPAPRVFLKAFTMNLVAFDRLRFYYFHRHNLSVFSNALLSGAYNLSLEQGSMLQNLMEDC